MNKESEIHTIAKEITAYLEARPDTADTLDGIGHWWLKRKANRRVGRVELERALAALVSSGEVIRSFNAAGKPTYVLVRRLG